MTTTRPLDVRLTEYRDILLKMADQLERMLTYAPVAKSREQIEAQAGLHSAVALYRIIAGDDLTKIIAGEELRSFVIFQEARHDNEG